MEPIILDEFSSDRIFRMTDYRIGLHHLLLRSRIGIGGEQNVDLIFAGIEYLELPLLLHGIRISRSQDDRAISLEQRAAVDTHYGERMFVLESGGRDFYIVASAHWILINTLIGSSLVPMCDQEASWEEFYRDHVKEFYQLR